MKQGGLTVISFLVTLFIGLSILTVLLRLMPAYFDDITVQRMFSQLQDETDFSGASARDVEERIAYHRRRGGIEAFEMDELAIDSGNGGHRVTLVYERRLSMIGNVDAVVTFEHEYHLGAE